MIDGAHVFANGDTHYRGIPRLGLEEPPVGGATWSQAPPYSLSGTHDHHVGLAAGRKLRTRSAYAHRRRPIDRINGMLIEVARGLSKPKTWGKMSRCDIGDRGPRNLQVTPCAASGALRIETEVVVERLMVGLKVRIAGRDLRRINHTAFVRRRLLRRR